jgi:hypothetical protein
MTAFISESAAFDAVEMQSFLDVHAQIYLEEAGGRQCARKQ